MLFTDNMKIIEEKLVNDFNEHVKNWHFIEYVTEK